MDHQRIVTIGREFGSGGHVIAEGLAKKLGIDFLDQQLIQHVAEQKGLSPEAIKRFDEKGTDIFFSRAVNGYGNTVSENIAKAQFEVLREFAADGKSFVVVGRCAEDVLHDVPGLISIFIRSDIPHKVQRVMDKYQLSEDKALQLMKKMDRERKYFHNYYCTNKWGDSRAYDLTVNSAMLGIDGTVDLLEKVVNMRFAETK